MHWFLILLIGLPLASLLWWLKTWQVAGRLAHPRRWRWGISLFFGLQLAGYLATILDRQSVLTIDFLLSRPVASAVFLWHLLLLPLCTIAWVLWKVGALIARAFTHRPRVSAAAVADDGLSRRDFLAKSFVTAPALFTIGATAVSQPQLEQFQLRRFTIPLPDLPPALDGFTIAQVSDLHVGRYTRGAVLKEIVSATNALKSDLVVLTGDLINYDLKDLPAALDLVKSLRGKHGVYSCVGNHDLIESPAGFINTTRDAGVPLLIDETASLDVAGTTVQLLGVGWARQEAAMRQQMERLLLQREADAFPILLAHHPHAWDFAGDVPLTFAGHTHGGQLMLTDRTGAGPLLFRYWSGLYQRKNRALLVSNGVGNWFPLRLRAPAEIIHVTLRRGTAV